MRLLPRSLHARMLALSALATLAALGIAGWVIAGVLERFVVDGLDRRLDSQVTLLAGTVDTDGRVDRARLRRQIAALEAGPGWRWQIATPDGRIGPGDFPRLDAAPPDRLGGGADRVAPPPRPGGDAMRPLDGAGRHDRAVHARQLRIGTARGVVTVTAAAPRDVIRRPIRDALTPLLATLAALATLLAAATIVQLRVGLRPLRRLRDQVAAIRAGSRERADEDLPTELKGLAIELNALAADTAAALATARLSAANLAHALKTPVTALALALRTDPARAAQVARIDATIRHHLARARAESANHRASTPLLPAVADLVTAVRQLNGDRRLVFAVDVAADLRVAVDPHDLDEMLGNLLDNAARHAVATVRVTAARDPAAGRHLCIHVADDGPGIPAAARGRAAMPGLRLDEHGDGHGFGLSITGNLAALYGGTLHLDERAGGGLQATLRLPTAGAE